MEDQESSRTHEKREENQDDRGESYFPDPENSFKINDIDPSRYASTKSRGYSRSFMVVVFPAGYSRSDGVSLK